MRLILFLLLLWPSLIQAQTRLDPGQAQVLQAGLIVTADAFILPAYQAQADAAEALVTALDGYCDGTGDAAQMQTAFAGLFLAWQRSSIIQFGPVMAAEGPLRVQLWPDTKRFSDRAIRSALLAKDPALLVPGGLKGRSIALTNLTALELLLYPTADRGSYGCALAQAIATFQADLASGLVADWSKGSAFRTDFDSAIDGNALYPSVDTLIRNMLAGATVYVDRLRKFKLLRGLGRGPGQARAERTEAQASALGLASIQTSFRTLADFYDTPFGLFDSAPEVGGTMDYYVLAQTAGNVADSLSFPTQTLTQIAAQDADAASQIRRLADLTLQHEAFFKTGFTRSIGLTAGFTAADGD